MGKASAKVLRITRTVYVLVDEADIEQDAWSEYFSNCDAELHTEASFTKEGTNESFGINLGWDEDDDDIV
jgi:hypothetical protein